VAQWRRVEVQLRVGDAVLAVAAQRGLQVADAHVVAHDGEVLALELLARDLQVARRRGQRLGRIEALVHLPPPRQQALHQSAVAAAKRTPQRAPDAPRGCRVDLHAEQAASGLREDLGQADSSLEARVGGRVRAPGALEQDDRLERVGLDPGRLRDGLDERPIARCPLSARTGAAGALRVDDVRVAARAGVLEIALARRRVGERIGAAGAA